MKDSATYWEQRHAERRGHWRANGPGSRGRLLSYKVALVQALVDETRAHSLLDLGCGDAQLGARVNVDHYLGVDVSPTAAEAARARLGMRGRGGTVEVLTLAQLPPAIGMVDVAISMDVVFHLLEDEAYHDHLQRLFDVAKRAVGIYSTVTESPVFGHVRHRAVERDVAALSWLDWECIHRGPPPWPKDEAVNPEHGSDCWWLVYKPRASRSP